VAAAASARFNGVTLELGGKSPNIIFADADLDAAFVGVLGGIFSAAGQSCVAGSRVLVKRPVYDKFVERLRARASSITSSATPVAASTPGRSTTTRPRPVFRAAVELGVTSSDTANVHGYGTSEEIVGRAIRKYPPQGRHPRHEGLLPNARRPRR
jgi:aldehyde dehydrogenase (NAD+)